MGKDYWVTDTSSAFRWCFSHVDEKRVVGREYAARFVR